MGEKKISRRKKTKKITGDILLSIKALNPLPHVRSNVGIKQIKIRDMIIPRGQKNITKEMWLFSPQNAIMHLCIYRSR